MPNKIQDGGGRHTEIYITVRHGSADTVVRAMNDFNGKCYFSGSDSSETYTAFRYSDFGRFLVCYSPHEIVPETVEKPFLAIF